GSSGTPWIQAVPASAGISGILFYAASTTPSQPFVPLYTDGKAPGGAATKILWVVQNGTGSAQLQITGTELAPESGSFQQTVPPASSPSNNSPSIVVVPSPGCWQLTLQTGSATASATFWVTVA